MNPDILELVKKAEEDLQVVHLLIEKGFLTRALSVNYFAMFYLAEALLLSEAKTFSSHAAVISAFGKDFVKTGRFPKHLHHYLVEAQRSRITSDYTLPGKFSKADAEQQLLWAEEFLAAAKSYLEGKE